MPVPIPTGKVASEVTAPIRVVVIHGDPSKPDNVLPGGKWDEDDFETLDELKKALSELGNKYTFEWLSDHETMMDDLRRIKKEQKVDLVLQICDEGFNNNPRMELHAIALLEMLDLPYTGASAKCIGVTYDKQNVLSIAKDLGVPVPQSVLIADDTQLLKHGLQYPVFVKPNSTDGSFGITALNVAKDATALSVAVKNIREHFGIYGELVVQEFLDGRDINVGVLTDEMIVLPITEEDYSEIGDLPKICGFESKWDEASPYWKIKTKPTTLSEKDQADVAKWSQALFKRLDAHDYARFDWRADANGKPRFIEANPNCGWCWDGHLAKTAGLSGISYPAMLDMILESATKRFRERQEFNLRSPQVVVHNTKSQAAVKA